MLQGSVPSPLFFAMFAKTVCPNEFVTRSFIFIQMTCKFIYREIVVTFRLIEDLERIFRWSTENELLLKPTKSQANLMSNSPATMPILLLGGVALEWKDVVTDLGLLIDGRLGFGRHVTKICSKVYATLHYVCSSS
jgi:hypothetical protein